MPNFLQKNWFWLLVATSLIVFATTLFPSWVLMLSVWFGLFFSFRIAGWEQQLSARQHQLYLLVVLFYPTLQTGVKWLIIHDRIPSSWWWVNRLEHGFWAMATSILFLPLFASAWKYLNFWQGLLFVVGLICCFGNLNECLEYFLSTRSGELAGELAANDYRDTIYDLIVNMMGGAIGFLFLRSTTTKQPLDPLNPQF